MNSLALSLSKLLFLTLVLLDAGALRAQTKGPVRFEVAKGGDVLLLPVQFNGKEYRFVLDTGCTTGVFDSTLPLGEARRTVNAATPTGPKEVKLFDRPEIAVGPIKANGSGLVASVDLKKIRQVSGYPIFGILGMDFLADRIIHIDFDRGELQFLDAVDDQAGDAFPLVYRRGSPYVDVRMGDKTEEFLIDTGSVGHGSGDVRAPLFDSLVENGAITVVGSTLTETIGGTRKHRMGRASELKLGPFKLSDPYVTESAMSGLGLEYWSRFAVTFDFRNHKVYLKKGANFDRPDQRDRSGLHFLREGDRTLIDAVDEGSAAAKGGIRAGDQLVSIAGARAAKTAPLQLRRLLVQPERRVEVVVRRGEAEIAVMLHLAADR